MNATARPTFRELGRAECEAILARNHVGRVAYARENHIDIEPLHYVYADGWIVGRTSRGAKLRTTGDFWWPVAFEVDEIEGVLHWRSVVVHGGFYTVPYRWSGPGTEEWRRGVELLQTLIPETFTGDDPVPHRTILFRIAVQEITGREAVPNAGRDPARD